MENKNYIARIIKREYFVKYVIHAYLIYITR